MGKGKGNFTGWITCVVEGQILFEMDGVILSNAQKVVALAAHKLCLSSWFCGFNWLVSKNQGKSGPKSVERSKKKWAKTKNLCKLMVFISLKMHK
jgi:hypothetical protein